MDHLDVSSGKNILGPGCIKGLRGKAAQARGWVADQQFNIATHRAERAFTRLLGKAANGRESSSREVPARGLVICP